jgi:hypothetical protein
MNIFSYSIKRSDREELEHGLGKRLSDVEYNSIVNSVTSLKENLGKIDLASILSPTETEAPKKPVEEEADEEGAIDLTLPRFSEFVNNNNTSSSTSSSNSNRFGLNINRDSNTMDTNPYRNTSGKAESPTDSNRYRLRNFSKKKYVSENQNWEEKYLKYKNKYLSLKQKMEN